MSRLFVFFLLTSSSMALASSLWIVGDSYLAFSDFKEAPRFVSMTATSWGFDNDQCRIWATNQNHEPLFADRGLEQISKAGNANRILSDIENSQFFTRSDDSSAIEKRDRLGALQTSFTKEWVTTAQALLFGSGLALHFIDKQNKLWLGHFSSNFDQTKTTDIPTGPTVWKNQRMLLDRSSNDIWLGFSTTTADHIYSPIVELRKTSGNREQLFSWDAQGLFFDFCLNGDRTVLASRDVPFTTGFTIPLYSYLEKLAPTGRHETIFEADVNLFIDALACNRNQVFMAQRSIWDSSNMLASWDRIPKSAAQSLFKLPGRVQALYLCE